MRWIGQSLLLAAVFSGCSDRTATVGPTPEYEEVARRLSAFIEYEMADKGLPALSIALVEDQRTVWAWGFGWADPVDSTPATAHTVYRVGSVSKLFTDVAVMQLVEQGRLSLDVPVTTYVPEFTPSAGGAPGPTLRQLTSHRSGLVREPPIGHYFDDTSPTLAETVLSLTAIALAYPPETRTKYSNAGIAAVGYVLERTTGEAFPDHLRRAVLAPLGMDRSSFEPDPSVVAELARAYMWTYDGRTFDAPTFELGMAPAGSMYAPVTDLAQFMSALFAGGRGARDVVLEPTTVDSMLTPQYAPVGAATGYGIGFRLSRLDGRRRIGHGGAIYGFATDLAALPDDKLGVVSVTTMDGANAVVGRINEYALRLMLARREGQPLPDAVITSPVPPELAAQLRGRYGPPNRRIEIRPRGDELYAVFPRRQLRLRRLEDDLVTDDRLGFGTRIRPFASGIVAGTDTLFRIPDVRPAASPADWTGLLGEYGWDHNTLYIFERERRLYALIEWFFIDPLQELSRDEFAFPEEGGLYAGERLVFRRDGSDRAIAVEAAGIVFPRRQVGTADGSTFTIDPVRPVDELRAEALTARPPEEGGTRREPDLVELRGLDSTIAYDIRYATTNNFMQAAFYEGARAFLQRPAAEALVRVHRSLRSRGVGLLIHDAYRPWYVTKMFWDATPDSQKIFVANPQSGSRHNRGAAVDLTLYELASGTPIRMVGGYDEFSDRSFSDYWGGTSRQRWYRELLRRSMEAEGFTVYEFEWWHFDYGEWAEYPILNATFDGLGR